MSTGTSPFIGAGQFGFKAYEWRKRFLNNPKAILEILETSYMNGARGIQVIPSGKILEAAQRMCERYSDYIIIGSTYPGLDSKIDALIEVDAKLIFVHGMVSDSRDNNLFRLLEEISDSGIIPGIASHEPVATIKYVIENSLAVKAFLIPFNVDGLYMENAKDLEDLVDNSKDYSFVGMKTLAAGIIKPEKAFSYISKHNISALAIGMVTKKQAEESTRIALKFLNSKILVS